TKGKTMITKSFDATVLAWTETELEAERAKLKKVADALTFDEIKNKNSDPLAVTSDLYLRQSAKLDGEKVTFNTYNSSSYPYKITWTIEPSGTITVNNGTGKVTRPAFDQQVTLKATITLKQPIVGEKSIGITVSGLYDADSLDGMKLVMDNIAATYDDNDDTGEWVILDMGAYAKLFPDAAAKTSAAAKQTYINGVVSMLTTGKNVSGWDASDGDYAKSILALHAVGIDPSQLYGVNSNTTLNACAKLKGMSFDSHYSAPYVLLADQFGDVKLSDEQTGSLVALLKNNQMESGLFGYEWDGKTFPDLDTTAAAIAGLAALYNTNDVAKEFIDKAIVGLSAAQDASTGSFGNANSDAMVIVGLAAMGIDPDTDSRFVKNGKSVVDGLLSYANGSRSGFLYNGSDNALATEQGFRALIAAYNVMATGTAYNVYDFSGNTLVPGRATGTGSVVTPSDPSGDNITVTLSIKSDTSYWLRSKTVTLPGTDATVYHALVNGLKDTGITQVGAETGYVKSMTKGGTTLEEFGSGKNAGWMYKVNGELPEVGLTDCEIENGDVIVWFYTEDWTSVPGTGGMGSGNQEETEEPTAFPFTDVSESDYYYEAVQWAVEKGITLGTSDTTFHPEAGCTRGQMVTFLWRAAGEPAAKTSDCVFTDVDKDAYYYEALLWAVENGITTGTSETKFSPDGDCTRGQMAVFLHRSAKTPAVSGSHTFDDVKSDAYYSDAVTWAAAEGITTGTSETTFHPNGDCTRGQMVTFLMRYLETIA
ncbi:MAG: S-layer homology domain-containing protein, partial [Ruminiclostridium sp.]|nr:S-layer homology domain-containing protein [Ruminiclostridium sp.]